MSGEDDFIARHFAPIAGPGGLGLRDDAALIAQRPGHDLVVTTDALVAGVHFFPDDPAGDIARKALRVNLSDLAAKGADPAGFVMTLALPRDCGDDWVARFAIALGEDARTFACPLLGGDTVATPGPLAISITAFGHIAAGKMVRRDGARAGDMLYVTGTIGDAALGLAVMQGRLNASDQQRAFLVERYRVPQPRAALARSLAACARAAMDVSDGFAGDLAKLLQRSGVGATIAIMDVPLSEAASALVRADPSWLETALTGGDDYEIICTVPEDNVGMFENAAAEARVHVTRLARIDTTTGCALVDPSGHTMHFAHSSYSHI